MKLEYRIFTVLMAVPFFIAVTGLFFLPSKVVMHWNIRGEADGYGSKFVLLLLPFAAGFMGLFLKEMFKSEKKSIAGAFGINIGTLVYFNLMEVVFIAWAYCGAKGMRLPDWLGINQSLFLSGVIAVISGVVCWKWERKRIKNK